MSALSVLAVSGSPNPGSRSAFLADRALESVAAAGVRTRHIRLADLDVAALVRCQPDGAGVSDYIAAVQDAHGVIFSTPVYKASFSGLMKAGIDVLPQFALAGKVVLPLGVGGSLAHVLALDYGFRPVLQSMAARHIVQAQFVCEADIENGADGPVVRDQSLAQLSEALRNFIWSLTDHPDALSLGHPRPRDR